MDFAEKILKIVKTNKLGINSPSSLEKYIKAGQGSITTPLREGTEPGIPTQKKIVEKLRINQDWWDTGKGQIYLFDVENSSAGPDGTIALPLKVWTRLERNFDNFEKNSETFERVFEKVSSENADLIKIIANLTGSGIQPHKMK